MKDSSPDPAAVDGRRSRLTPSAASKVTSLHRNANATPVKPIKWTNEKHSLYLGYLEESFVKQLHGSTGLLGWHSQEKALNPNSIRKLPSTTCNQFTVLNSGCWRKKKFVRNEPSLSPAADSHVISESPWIYHFRSAGKRRIVTTTNFQERRPFTDGVHCEKRNPSPGLETCPERLYACQQDSVDSITEVSDQNFEDEDQGNNHSTSSMAKRCKVDAADTSSNDQVVPSGKLSTTEAITSNATSTKREDSVNHHKISPNPEHAVCPKSDVEHFSKES